MSRRITKKEMAGMKQDLEAGRACIESLRRRSPEPIIREESWEAYNKVLSDVTLFALSLRSSWDEERAECAYTNAQWALVMAVSVTRYALRTVRDPVSEEWVRCFGGSA